MLAEDQKRLAIIDHLYSLRLDRHVSLPMLVVVGDQSSGKSSVLEGLTGLPFPRDAGLCTRFPTQVVFQRSVESRVCIRILPFDHQEQDEAQSTILDEKISTFDEQCFLQALRTACEKMDLPMYGEKIPEGRKSFSYDVLKIELSGPDYDHFSVVDLPGLFRKPSPGLTSREDMDFVKNMVKTYLGSRRSIILAVVPANVDIATQEIVQMAEDADPNGKRTLGVLTKPDLVDYGAEHKVMELVMSRKCSFALGYIVVCNRSQSKLSITHQERNDNEKDFFSTPPWSQIPSDCVGITALRNSLNKLLVQSARESFTDVARDIQNALATCETKLSEIGPLRSTEMTQRLHLLQIATSYQRLTSHALDAYYGRDACFSDNRQLRLATLIKTCQENFSDAMRTRGSTRKFGCQASGDTTSGTEDDEGDGSTSAIGEEHRFQPSVHQSGLQLEYPKSEAPDEVPGDTIYEWIRRNYHRSKGFEIGTINPAILPVLYHEQIRHWRFHTCAFMSRIISIVHTFVEGLIGYLCPSNETATRLLDALSESLHASYTEAIKQAKFLLDIEEHGNMRTLNHYFAITLRKVQFQRRTKRLESCKTWTSFGEHTEPLLKLSDVLSSSLSNEDQVVEDLHDALQSYYKVARKQFVDAVCKGPVDYLLLVCEQGPLKALSPSFIGSLTPIELTQIAGETAQAAKERADLEKEMSVLRSGLDSLKL